jgi:hypothetical protein
MVQVLPLALLLVLVQLPLVLLLVLLQPFVPLVVLLLTSTLVATRALATLCGRDQHFWVDEKKAHEALVETSLRLMFNSLRRDVCGVYGRGCGLT